jgi:hypothetical protein
MTDNDKILATIRQAIIYLNWIQWVVWDCVTELMYKLWDWFVVAKQSIGIAELENVTIQPTGIAEFENVTKQSTGIAEFENVTK